MTTTTSIALLIVVVMVFGFTAGKAFEPVSTRLKALSGRMTMMAEKIEPVGVSTVCEFNYMKGAPVTSFAVTADTSMVRHDHPVIKVVLDRWKKNSVPGNRERDDVDKVALAIEGGGMRGCVSAGATAALQYLGLADSVDIVYGSSAGSMVGSYFITRQTGGMGIYHDILPSAGTGFIDKRKLLVALLAPSFMSMEGRSTDVFNLNFLLDEVMAQTQPLDWSTFKANQEVQPLKIVASSIRSFEPVVMSLNNGDFHDLDGMLMCIRSSMGVPGITGGLMGKVVMSPDSGSAGEENKPPAHPIVLGEREDSSEPYCHALPMGKTKGQGKHRYTQGAPLPSGWELDPLVDALVAEPIPYRSAAKDGATHVIALRTRPDPSPILGKGPGVYEKIISRRYFTRYAENEAADFLISSSHHRVYAEDLVRLNDAAYGPAQGIALDEAGGRGVHLLPIAPHSTCAEVGQLEMRRDKLLVGMRDGARRTLELFYPPMAAQTPSSKDKDEKEVQNDIEMMVEQLFPMDEITTTVDDFLQCVTHQQGHAIKKRSRVEEKATPRLD